jgi:NAD(P)H-hydrate epimerase
MRHLLTEGRTRSVEAAAVAAGLTLAELMDRAGSAVAVEVSSVAPDGKVVVMAGAGNNGGDGWVAGRRLHEAGRDVLVLTATEPDSLTSPAREAVRDAIGAGVPWLHVESAEEAAPALAEAGVIVDALIGIGLHGVPRQPLSGLISAIDGSDAIVVSVDIPSGVCSDTGTVHGPAVAADVTVTFSAPKVGCVLQPGRHFAGELRVADIGIDPASLYFAGAPESWDVSDYAECLPHPHWDDRKGTRGRVLIIGGSPGLTGAVCLAAGGALRSGAGYVAVAVPVPVLAIAEMKLTAPVKAAMPATPDGALESDAAEWILEAAARADAVVLGPGLGRARSTCDVVRRVVEKLEVPLLIDADALYALGHDLELVAARVEPTVITPHSGEAARLLATTVAAVDADRTAAARGLAVGNAVVVMKGPATLVAQGSRVVVNSTGGPGLATLGTGDVLSGTIGALLARGMLAIDAAVLGVYLHGAAGDAASRDLTAICCTAEDVVAYLPEAVRTLMDSDRLTNRRRNQR